MEKRGRSPSTKDIYTEGEECSCKPSKMSEEASGTFKSLSGKEGGKRVIGSREKLVLREEGDLLT